MEAQEIQNKEKQAFHGGKHNSLSLLMVGSESRVLEDGSPAQKRIIEYGSLVKRLDIILFSKHSSHRLPRRLSSNIMVYPTDSYTRWLYTRDGVRLGKTLLCPSLITAQDPFEAGEVAIRLGRFFGAPVELQVHTDFFSPAFAGESMLNRLRVFLATRQVKKAQCIRAVSGRIKDDLAARAGIQKERVAVLPIFVDVDALRSAPVKEDLHVKFPRFTHIVLMVSRLEKEKNILLALYALKEVTSQYPAAGLVVVGEGSKRKELEALVAKLSLKKHVVFEGWRDDLASYYKTADLFLNTSEYEGYGRTLVEALAAGLPALSTDVGAAKEAGAEVVEGKDIADALRRALGRGRYQATLHNYPYKDRDDYLEAIKRGWSTCAQKDR